MDQVRQLELEQYFLFAGAVQNIATVYTTLNIFVLPSLTEGLHLALLEAMPCGLPVVASAVDGIPRGD